MKQDEQQCCICGEVFSSAEAVMERRPTGLLWTKEDWSYWVSCWFTMEYLKSQRLDTGRLLETLEATVSDPIPWG